MTWYVCDFNGRRKLIDALSRDDCMHKFQERFGFWPNEDLVTIEISKVRPVYRD